MNHDELHSLLADFGSERRIHYSLDRFEQALKFLGNPEKNVNSLVIAGTNGKGTTTLLVSNSLAEAGYRVGSYLSPHLQHPCERFLENLKPISESRLTELARELKPVALRFELSYFEFLTLTYFVWAARQKFDFSVLEVGLGGRLDATNVTHPLACAVTNIAFDHQAYLGNTLNQILSEKLGVLKSEGLLFTGITDPELLDSVESTCQAADAIYYYSRELKKEVESRTWAGQQIRINGHPFWLNNPSLGTVENASLAFLLLRIVFPAIPLSTLQRAFAKVRFPGRMEVVQDAPRVILSGDHNPAGVQNLADSLKGLASSKLFIVCAFSPDKPFREMIQTLKTLTPQVTLTTISRFKDEMPPDYGSLMEVISDAKEAIKQTLQEAGPQDTVIVTGSLYLVAEVRSLWLERVKFVENEPVAPLRSLSAPGDSNRPTLRPTELKRNHAPQVADGER